MRRLVAIATLLTLAALGFRLFLALRLPNDDDDDGRFYSQLARNLLDHHGYSGEEEEPYVPTYVRVPGYPLFLAGVYAVFGLDNNRAVRVIQAMLDTLTCWLIALLAYAWSPTEWQVQRRRRTMLIALVLAVACPFTAIYVTTILTETWAILLTVSLALAATLALKSERDGKALSWWLAAGLLGGALTMFRPDCALHVGSVGVMLIMVGILRASRQPRLRERNRKALALTLFNCAALSIGFAAVLTPWTIRNARVFGVFQPVAPQYANDPGKPAPIGYIAWLRTWVDDERYVSTIEDGLDLYPILIERIPDYAFDSAEERERVQALLDRYNNQQGLAEELNQAKDSDSDPPTVKMTAEIDAQFGEIARERIARNPLRQHVLLPVKRALSMWFDTHSQLYPFQGELFPLYDLDTDAGQQYWLSLFAMLTWLYSILGLAGVWLIVRAGSARRWALLLGLLILPRLAFLSFQEHPEARYTVECFALVAAAAAIALARMTKSNP